MGVSPIFTAYHDGYINEFSLEASSFEEAESLLRNKLMDIINDEIDSTLRMLAAPNKYDVQTVTKERAEEIRKEVFGA